MARERRQPEIIAGRVNSDGSIAAGDGFTVQKTATGTYTLTFVASGFRLVSVAATLNGFTGISAVIIDTYSERSCRALTFINNASTDAAWNFIAAGVQT